mmetsp:Transcript_16016/g.33873  ORF Transcript_16016/g.33873 Transcript_16016/m.33873 type:complete len:320 (+) Transcript_16016:2540-3499(+)
MKSIFDIQRGCRSCRGRFGRRVWCWFGCRRHRFDFGNRWQGWSQRGKLHGRRLRGQLWSGNGRLSGRDIALIPTFRHAEIIVFVLLVVLGTNVIIFLLHPNHDQGHPHNGNDERNAGVTHDGFPRRRPALLVPGSKPANRATGTPVPTRAMPLRLRVVTASTPRQARIHVATASTAPLLASAAAFAPGASRIGRPLAIGSIVPLPLHALHYHLTYRGAVLSDRLALGRAVRFRGGSVQYSILAFVMRGREGKCLGILLVVETGLWHYLLFGQDAQFGIFQIIGWYSLYRGFLAARGAVVIAFAAATIIIVVVVVIIIVI